MAKSGVKARSANSTTERKESLIERAVAFIKQNPKKTILTLTTAFVMAVTIVVGSIHAGKYLGIADKKIGEQSNQIIKNEEIIDNQNTTIGDQQSTIEEQKGTIDEQQETIDKQQQTIDELSKKQSCEITTEQLATIKGYMQGKGGKIIAFDSFTCDGTNLNLFFKGKSAAGNKDTIIAFSMKAESTAFNTADVMAWLASQSKSENPEDRPEISVFASAEDLGVKTQQNKDAMQQMLVQLAGKKNDLASEQLDGKIVEDAMNGETTVVAEAMDTMFSIQKSTAPDSKGNYKVVVKGLSKDINGKYVIDEIGSQVTVNQYSSNEDIVMAGITAYCEKYGIEKPAEEVELG